MSAKEPHEERAGTVSLADEVAVKQILVSTVFGLWEIVNNLTRLQPKRRLRYRATNFWSAGTDPEHWLYAPVRDLAAELTRLGSDIITGGGPELMQAENEGGSDRRGGPRPVCRGDSGRLAVRPGG
jgi:hypothetical protein